MKFENLQFKEADDGKNILVTSSLKSSDPAHSVIAYNSERGQFGDYWARTYVAPIDEKTGAFAVTATSPHLTSQKRIVISLLQFRIGNQYIGRAEAIPKGQFDFGSVC